MQQLSVNGRRDELLPATSLQVRRGELLLVSGNRQDQRTALALALSGRLKPSGGHFEWDGAEWDGGAKIKTLRQASAVVDSPGVNEPEQHLSVRDLVTEDLALVPRRYRGSLLSRPWLKVNRFEDIAGLWTEQLPAARRIELLTALALANPHTDLLVVDSPDRHGDPRGLAAAAGGAGVRRRPSARRRRHRDAHPGGLDRPRRRDRQRASRAHVDPAPERLEAIQHTRNRGRKVTVLRLARSELKRMTGGLLPKLTILALTMVPLLYGAVYLYANWDPYGKLNQIDAALVVEDTGATLRRRHPARGRPEGRREPRGRARLQLADGLRARRKRTRASARGKYAFALKIPQDFSANLVSPGSFDAANQAMLNVTTNDANNYLLSTIVDKLTTAVHTTVATEVGEETANQLLTGFGTIHSQMLKASDGAGQLADGVASLHDGTVTLHQGTGDLKNGTAELHNGQLKLRDGANALSSGGGQAQRRTVPAQGQDRHAARRFPGARGRRRAGGGRQRRAQYQDAGPGRPAGRLRTGSRPGDSAAGWSRPTAGSSPPGPSPRPRRTPSWRTSMPTQPRPRPRDPQPPSSPRQAQIQQLADGSAAVSAGAAKLAGATPALGGAISQASTGADQLASGAATLAAGQQGALDGAAKLSEGAQKLDDGAARLESGAATASDGAGTLAG